jgi:hypothetical protein
MVYNEFNCRATDFLYYYLHFIADEIAGIAMGTSTMPNVEQNQS